MAMKAESSQTQSFPAEGGVRARQIAQHLSIGVSTWWLYVRQRRVKPPVKYGRQVSVWDAGYIRALAKDGIPEFKAGEGDV